MRNKNTRESVPLTLAQKSQLFEFLDAHTAEYSPETKAVPFTVLYKVLGLPDGTGITDYMRDLCPFVSGQAEAYLIGCGAPRPTIPRAQLCPNL